jgi:hypothetical protein
MGVYTLVRRRCRHEKSYSRNAYFLHQNACIQNTYAGCQGENYILRQCRGCEGCRSSYFSADFPVRKCHLFDFCFDVFVHQRFKCSIFIVTGVPKVFFVFLMGLSNEIHVGSKKNRSRPKSERGSKIEIHCGKSEKYSDN